MPDILNGVVFPNDLLAGARILEATVLALQKPVGIADEQVVGYRQHGPGAATATAYDAIALTNDHVVDKVIINRAAMWYGRRR